MRQTSMADYRSWLGELGCGAEQANEILRLLQSGQTENAALLLKRHKQKLLAQLHNAEHKVDLLDFLLYHIKNTGTP